MRNVVLFSCLVAVVLISTCWGQCPNGFPPLSDNNCVLGGVDCPDFSSCEISPVDANNVCCPYCRNGPPLLDPSGTAINCGRGGVECPLDYYCEIEQGDRWTVCCRN